MTDVKTRMGAGDVRIVLVDENGDEVERVLKPSYMAARALSGQSGGLIGALQRVGQFDLETITQVIALGLGYGQQSNKAPKNLAERVYATGVSDDTGGLAERCVTFIRVLMSGGRLPVNTPERADDDEGSQESDAGPTEG